MRKRPLTILWIIAFLCLTVLPTLSYPVLRRMFGRGNTENADEITRPRLTTETFSDFPAEYEDYYNQHLPFRSQWITLNSMIDFFAFGDTTSDSVIIGRDGWLFYTEEGSNPALVTLYTQEELDGIADNLCTIRDDLQAHGTDFILYVAPNKSTIYGQYLPERLQESAGGAARTVQMIDYLRAHTDLNIIYPADILRTYAAAHPDHPIYFHLDTHWNMLGAYIGTGELLQKMGIDTPAVETLTVTATNEPYFNFTAWDGYDLANLLGLTNVLKRDTNYRVEGYTDRDITLDPDLFRVKEGYATYTRATGGSDPRKLFFARDSFGLGMLPYLGAAFSEVYSPHVNFMTPDLIDAERPDIVVLELVERVDWRQLTPVNWNP